MNDQIVMTGIGLAVVLTLTLLLHRYAGIGLGWQPVIAGVRAILQLAVIALILNGVFSQPWTAALFVVLMMSVAALTASGRLKDLHRGRVAAIAGVCTAAIISITLVFALRMMEFEVRYIIAIAGIVIGNSMSGVTLTGRNFMRSSYAHRGEVEGWLALGARPRQAFARISQESIREALIPTIDQTKSTGLVTLPGAFVGAIMGGASPVEAARFQVVVLVTVMLAITIGGIITTRILSTSPVVPIPPDERDNGQKPAPSSSTPSKDSEPPGPEGSSSSESDMVIQEETDEKAETGASNRKASNSSERRG